MGEGRPEVEISGLAYSSRSVVPGTLFFCVPRLHGRRPRLRRRRRRARRGGAGLRAAARPRRARGDRRRRRAPRWGRRRPASTATRRPSSTSSASPAPTARPRRRSWCAHLLEAGGHPDRAARHGQVGRRRGGGARSSAPRPRRSTCRRPSGGCSTRATAPCAMEVSSHALELGRAAGIRFALPGLHEPHPGPPRLPRDDGGLLRRQAAAVRAEPGALDRQRRRRVRPPARGRAARGDHVRDRPRGRLPRARRELRRRPASRFTVDTPDGDARRSTRRCRACSTCRTCWPRWPRRALLGVDARTRSRAALAVAGRVPGRFEPVDEGQDFGVLVDYAHTPDSLENVLRAARADDPGPAARGVRRRRRPRQGQAPADGRGGAGARRPR